MLVLSYTVASRYYICCTDGSTSSGNYRYNLIFAGLTSDVAIKIPSFLVLPKTAHLIPLDLVNLAIRGKQYPL
jgi:hypothetical protein